MWDPFAEFQSAMLPNGLRVHVASWPYRPWVSVGFIIHAGARLDKVGFEGTAHFVEHLVSRNTPLTYRKINDFFEESGGGVSLGATSHHRTYYNFFVPLRKFEEALQIFGSMLLSGNL